MIRSNGFAVVFGLGAALTVLSAGARADQWNERTTVKFNQPVEIPGMVLPPGTYTFKLLDSQVDRNIVQIFNQHETHLYATIIAVPDYRLKPRGKTVITFEERASGAPEAIQAWFYPGDNYGQQFVYPKPRAMELAKAANQPVLSMPAKTAENITKPAESATEPSVMAMKQTPVKAQKPTGEEVEMAKVVTPPPQQMAKRLPQTGSDMPLVGLFGLMALGLAGGLRLLSRRIA